MIIRNLKKQFRNLCYLELGLSGFGIDPNASIDLFCGGADGIRTFYPKRLFQNIRDNIIYTLPGIYNQTGLAYCILRRDSPFLRVLGITLPGNTMYVVLMKLRSCESLLLIRFPNDNDAYLFAREFYENTHIEQSSFINIINNGDFFIEEENVVKVNKPNIVECNFVKSKIDSLSQDITFDEIGDFGFDKENQFDIGLMPKNYTIKCDDFKSLIDKIKLLNNNFIYRDLNCNYVYVGINSMKRVLPENEGKYKSLNQRELFAILNFNSEEVLEMERAERDKFYLIDNLVYGTKYSEDLEKDTIEGDWCNDFTYIPRLECQQSKSLREKFVPNIIGAGEIVEGKIAKVKPDVIKIGVALNHGAFFDEAHIKAIHDAKIREGLGVIKGAMPVGLDADIDKPKAPEDAFEAKPKKHVDWWDYPF